MKVFVTGVKGQLGFDVMRRLAERGIQAVGSDITTCSGDGGYIGLDITDRKAVMDTIEAVRPDAVVHCAAWTAVDAAEEKANCEKAAAVNYEGTRNIAEACRAAGAGMVYISTDYVFDGQGTEPWQPDCSNFCPLNVYGRTKLMGEQAVTGLLEDYFIVRIAWVFGINGKNFVKTMLSLADKYETLRVVNDQIGSPTYTYDAAGLIADMLGTEKYGFYHAVNEGGYISWADFAAEIFRQAGRDTRVIPVSTAEYGLSTAKRPFNSRMATDKLAAAGFDRLPHWRDALGRYLRELGVTR